MSSLRANSVIVLIMSVSALFGAEDRTFFENHIRPVLVDSCYRCHGENPEKLKSGLNLTHREGLLTGGRRGPALVPGDVDASRLLQALEYRHEDLKMPPSGKLPDAVIDNFRAWVATGASDPRDHAFVPGQRQDENDWKKIRELRRAWWSFQPIKAHRPPQLNSEANPGHPVDRFIQAKLAESGLSPASGADARTLIRRLTFVLTGLPPTPKESDHFVAAVARNRQEAIKAAVDRLLASPHFGERWARHWMDWMRYAESHGSEGDPIIPYAWRYRDYLIRALNADVPYDQLLREHLAGDILAQPRVNETLKLNESALGAAQYRFVLHGFSPTDALEEQIRFTENQIDVVSKGFLALTVACARCHNHKFDPISQKDFYALYGIMASTRPASVTVDTPDHLNTHKVELAALKHRLRQGLSGLWLLAVDDLPQRLLHPTDAWKAAVEGETENEDKKEKDKKRRNKKAEKKRMPFDPLYVWRSLRAIDDKETFAQRWAELREEWLASESRLRARESMDYEQHWDLTGEQSQSWYGHGTGVTLQPSPAGEFSILPEGDGVVGNILPAGMYSHTLSSKHNAILASPRFLYTGGEVFVRVIGGGHAAARYVVQNYPLGGTTYPLRNLNEERWHWQGWDASYWRGDHLHIEIATAADQPARGRIDQERSWFGITEALVVKEGQAKPQDEVADFITPLFATDTVPGSIEALAARYAEVLRGCLLAWRDGTMTDAQARFLDYFVGMNLLPNRVEELLAVDALLARYQRLESEVPVPTRAPGVLEGNAFDQALLVRGDHRQAAEPVKRRFLEVFDETPYQTPDAGRLALASSVLDPNNTLTSRVIVNRLWHHVFGTGIVPTPDNFGRLGEPPSHPELLDYLAVRFVKEGWSIKTLLRLLVTSHTFQQGVTPSAQARRQDPANRLLSHGHVRRLEAEVIRDTLLKVAGRLDMTLYGKPVDGGDPRRSVYVRVIRNDLDPFLSVFDFPVPTSTTARRNATNVPAQALAMMNDPMVIDLAEAFATRLQQEVPDGTGEKRIDRMFRLALGRPPTPAERAGARSFLADVSRRAAGARNETWVDAEIADRQERLASLTSKQQQGEKARLAREIERLQRRTASPNPWAELAHAIFSMKEFIYLN